MTIRRSKTRGARTEALLKIAELTRMCHRLELQVASVTLDERLRDVSRRVAALEERLDLARTG